MNPLNKKLEKLAFNSGVDSIGFSPTNRFDSGPEKTHPNYYMSSARSVIVLSMGYPRSIGDAWGTYREKGGFPTPYMWYGFAYLNWELSHIALKLSKELETHGYKSLPIPPSHTLVQYRYYEEFDETGRYLGDFSHKHAALLSGVGVFGWNNLIITPEYGTHQRLISVITEAPLEASKLLSSETLCKPNKCDYHCVEVCPVNALSRDKSQEFNAVGQTYKYAELDHMLCRWCLDGFVKESGSRTDFSPPENLTQEDFVEAASKREIPDKGLYLMAFIDFCGKCMHQCPSPEFTD